MKKVKSIIIVLLSVLLARCANSNNTKEPIEALEIKSIYVL